MPRKPKDDPQPPAKLPEQVMGGKYVRLLENYVKQLRDEQAHGNRKLFLDDVFVVQLLAFFNPAVRTLRTFEDFSRGPQVQKHLTIRKLCKSTLSDFNKLADPSRLELILRALRKELSRKNAGRPQAGGELQALLKQTVAVDGTWLPALADVAWAVANSNNHKITRHRARIDAHVNVASWLPDTFVLPDPGQSEADCAAANLKAGYLYLYDRGYPSFALLRAHYEETADGLTAKSHFVMRFKTAGGNSPTLCDWSERALTEKDRAAGILSDRVGYFSSDSARRSEISKLPLREVLVQYEEKGETKTLRIVTNLTDVSAATIALLYRQRWQIELFFRWFKSIANFGHLLSHSRDGVLTHLYVTIIGTLLMYLHTGYRPSKYTFVLLGMVASGGATLEDIMPILRERERQCEVARQSAARRRARKQAEAR